MGDLTKNISRSELACKCGCGFDTADIETVIVLQACCDHFARQARKGKVILDITSGCRCEEYNKNIGGSENSQHVKGRAIDFVIRGVSPSDVYAYLAGRYSGQFGIGRYRDFTHIDSKSGPQRRW